MLVSDSKVYEAILFYKNLCTTFMFDMYAV